MEDTKPDARRPTSIDEIVKQTQDLSVSEAQIIPNEVLGFVIGYLKKDEQYKTLASIAQCSQGLYELAVPKLYETVTVTKENQDMLVYGHSLASPDPIDTQSKETQSKGKEQARKDFATTHTRKCILETIPTAPIFECYPAVKEVVIKDVWHGESNDKDEDWHHHRKYVPDSEYVPPPIYDTLAAYSLKHASSEPLHVDIQDSHSTAFRRLKLITNREKEKAVAGEPHDRITYGFHDMQKNCARRMVGIYMMRGIVSFWKLEVHKVGSYASFFADILGRCFRKDGIGMGRLYMIGVPELVLLPTEIDEAGEDVNEAALLKIWNSWVEHSPWSHAPKPKWEDFIARIHLVEPGYRRSMADVAEDHTKYLKDRAAGPIFWMQKSYPICTRGLRPGAVVEPYWYEM